jgi:hypothetical protein
MTLLAALSVAACGETDLVMDELTEAEASDLAGTILLATFDATDGGAPTPAPGGPALAPFDYSADLEVELDCPLGGTVSVSAEVTVAGDTETNAATAEYAMTQVHDACGVLSEEERHFVLSGTPGLTLELVVARDGQGVTEWEGSVIGAVEWVNDEREGTCEVALEFSARREFLVSFEAELSGVACGSEVTRTFSLGGESDA